MNHRVTGLKQLPYDGNFGRGETKEVWTKPTLQRLIDYRGHTLTHYFSRSRFHGNRYSGGDIEQRIDKHQSTDCFGMMNREELANHAAEGQTDNNGRTRMDGMKNLIHVIRQVL